MGARTPSLPEKMILYGLFLLLVHRGISWLDLLCIWSVQGACHIYLVSAAVRIDRDRGRSNSCSNSQFRNGSSSSTTECGICMDSNAAISMQPCSHRVCHSCALHIC